MVERLGTECGGQGKERLTVEPASTRAQPKASPEWRKMSR